METREDAIAFGYGSAVTAIDQIGEYKGNLSDAIASYRQNVRDTLQEYRLGEFEAEAFDAFDGYIARMNNALAPDEMTIEDIAIMSASRARCDMVHLDGAETLRTMAKVRRVVDADKPNRLIAALETHGSSFEMSPDGRASIIWAR